MVYGMAGGHGIVYSMVLWAWQGIRYDLAGIAWYMVCHGLAGIGGLWYGLVYRMAWYIVWPSGHAGILLTTNP